MQKVNNTFFNTKRAIKTMNKTIIKKLLTALLISLVTLTSSLVASAEPIKIRFSHIVAENTPKGQMARKFQQLLSERLGGDVINVMIYPNSSLFSDNEVGEELLKGTVEMAAPSVSKLKKYTKRLQVFDIPFLFVTPESANNFLQGPYGKRMLRLVGRKGLLGLGFLNNGMKQLSATTPIRRPEDVKGLKFRIMNSDVLAAQFEQVDAIPMRKPFSKVYSLLQNKEIDGQENTWSNIYSKKFFEHQPHIIESNHGYLGYMIITNAKFWQTIPAEIKPTIEKSLAEAIDFGNQIALQKVTEDRQNIVETGKSEIHIMSLDERKAWVTAMQPIWKSYENEIGSELIQAAASAR